MQRQAGDDGVERFGIAELLKRGGTEEVAHGRVGVDRHDAVTGASERPREVTAAAPHLEHPGGHRRKMRVHERVELHPRLSAACHRSRPSLASVGSIDRSHREASAVDELAASAVAAASTAAAVVS